MSIRYSFRRKESTLLFCRLLSTSAFVQISFSLLFFFFQCSPMMKNLFGNSKEPRNTIIARKGQEHTDKSSKPSNRPFIGSVHVPSAYIYMIYFRQNIDIAANTHS